MKKPIAYIFALLALTAVACDGIVGGDDDNFTFAAVAIAYDSAMVDNAEAVTVLRNIQIDGIIVLPHACHEVKGDYQRSGGTITLTVNATPVNPSCAGGIAPMQYRMQTFGLSRGPYRVRVYHRIGNSQTVLIAEHDLVV